MRQAYETAPSYEKAKVASYGLAYARRLAESGDLQTANTICEYLMSGGQVNVRSAALATLADIGHPSAQSLLLAAMDDPDLAYRAAALKLAARFPSTEATRQWLARMQDVSPEVRAEIIAMLGRRGDNIVSDTLTRQILAEDKVVRLAAIDAATTIAGSRAVAPMLDRLSKGGRGRRDPGHQVGDAAHPRATGRQGLRTGSGQDPGPGAHRPAGCAKQRHAGSCAGRSSRRPKTATNRSDWPRWMPC